MNQILQGDALQELKKLEANTIDLVCTDPPYGYSFMGKDWDKAVPSVDIWQECLRVLKPGAFCFVMSAPRSDVQMHMITNLTKAGFRLDFTPIYWTYASGFPKAGNIGKLVDKRNGVKREVIGEGKGRTGQAIRNHSDIHGDDNYKWPGKFKVTKGSSQLEGSYAGFQPKPAVEVVIVAMKPLSEKTYVDQALKNSKGITWLDDCRVPTGDGKPAWNYPTGPKGRTGQGTWNDSNSGYKPIDTEYIAPTTGRFPANLLVSDDVLNDGTIIKTRPSKAHTIDKNVTGDERTTVAAGIYGKGTTLNGTNLSDSGSYSRYFDLDKWASTLPFLIVPKASKSEKNKGLELLESKKTFAKQTSKMIHVTSNGQDKWLENPHAGGTNFAKNHHPTVKPLKLMSYLITLGSREGDVVLDPFVGSGTTCVAAKKLKRNYIGIELDPEYVEIANARLEADKQESLL